MELFVVFFFGLCIGLVLRDRVWLENAMQRSVLRRRGRLYKVVEVEGR